MLDATPLPMQAAVSLELSGADTSILDVDWVNSAAVGPRVSAVYLPALSADH